MSSSSLEVSVIPEGRISRDDVIEKLHLSYLSGVTPDYLASLPLDEFEAATNQVVGLFSSAFSHIQMTYHKWLMYGFNCGSTSASGNHRNSNPAAQIKKDAGWNFGVSGLSCDQSDIAAEQAKAFSEGEKKRRYQAEFTEAMAEADTSFRVLLRKVSEVKRKWDPEQLRKYTLDDVDGGDADDEDADDEDSDGEYFSVSNSSQRHQQQRNAIHVESPVPGKPEEFNESDKLRRLEELLIDARQLHENIVNMVLRFLPGRTFLKS